MRMKKYFYKRGKKARKREKSPWDQELFSYIICYFTRKERQKALIPINQYLSRVLYCTKKPTAPTIIVKISTPSHSLPTNTSQVV